MPKSKQNGGLNQNTGGRREKLLNSKLEENKVYILNWNAEMVMFYSFLYVKIKTKWRI
jgi:hypothetical protein